MREQPAAPDRFAACIAARQHGVISYRQLLDGGIDKDGIRRRLDAGRLHRLHRGVYAVGHRGLGWEGRWLAAVFACGADAVLSHRSAAELWGLLPALARDVDVTLPEGGSRARRPGIRIHRSRTLTLDQTTRRLNIPLTSPSRTLTDLRIQVDAATLRRATRQAAVIGLVTEGEHGDPTRSELEDRFLRLCRRHRLPTPEVNVGIDRFLVDFLWRDSRLVVETDGYRYHRGRQAFEDDRARDLQLHRLGFQVLRVSYKQVVEGPGTVAVAIRAALSR
jgi:very-short-patch-repair endonuclease